MVRPFLCNDVTRGPIPLPVTDELRAARAVLKGLHEAMSAACRQGGVQGEALMGAARAQSVTDLHVDPAAPWTRKRMTAPWAASRACGAL